MNTSRQTSFHLLLAGAAPRLAVAAAVAALVWLGFFWATTPPGAP